MESNLNVVGIIRTLDDLGRVVIPKEIRRVIGVKEGDSLDIIAMTDGSILLRKVVDNKPVCGCPCATKTEPEKKVVSFVDTLEGTTKVARITAEQDKFLDWLIRNDYLYTDIDVIDGYPEVEDLT
jgi:AbrB family looped-hinge helix DNA binding protein